MKTKIILFCCLAVALFGESKTVFVSPGENVEVRALPTAQPKSDSSITRAETKEVVRALEILMKFAPEKYAKDYLSTVLTGTGTFTTLGYASYPSRKTKADELRDEATTADNAAQRKREEAARMDKEQEEIEWARGILAKWKTKLANLD